MKAAHEHAITVAQTALDENGHVNNVVYVQWMQDAAVAHADAAGCTRATRELGATWVARSHQIEYLRPAFEGDELVVVTWVADMRKATSLRKYEFLRRGDGAVLARGETNWVFVDVAKGRPRVIPETVRASFEIVAVGAEPTNGASRAKASPLGAPSSSSASAEAGKDAGGPGGSGQE